jgi:hypothetical protein
MSDNEDWILALLAAGPGAAAYFYWSVFRRYRNTDKTGSYEYRGGIAVQQVENSDTKTGHIAGTQAKEIQGRNEAAFRQRVKRIR